jgi:hypothetical protein
MGMILQSGYQRGKWEHVSVAAQKSSASLNAALAVVAPTRSTELGITTRHNQDYAGPCILRNPDEWEHHANEGHLAAIVLPAPSLRERSLRAIPCCDATKQPSRR